ncbi:MAG TPA: 3-deoxy-D-manno-octulosonate 8-phosphate phosphatase [Prolixibacteraceae bacterium]|jgi:3-deoxy-D-manno-octulosonate 8-phosphate phosphatase (KDO 8-P phosphatase)|nr:3-deoxy-D-manno-octulosonate 8-phosphate phosphatase [Prolixibacteraceae bacterium]
MSFFKDDLKEIKAILLDVDGVLSSDTSPLDKNGDPMRTANVKDGFAIRQALLSGIVIGVITGGAQNRVRKRHLKLGITHYYDNVSDKTRVLHEFVNKTGISPKEILFMGDDLVDHSAMLQVGISACPSDAVPEIKLISRYISDHKGGDGCVRDVIEQVMRAQGKWFNDHQIEKQAF